MAYFTDNSLSIGNTPLVRLNRIVDPARATVLARKVRRFMVMLLSCKGERAALV